MQSSRPPGFMPLVEASAWAGVSPRTLRRWFGQGLPRYQAAPRGKVLIRPGDIEQFLTRQQIQQRDLDKMVNEVIEDLLR